MSEPASYKQERLQKQIDWHSKKANTIGKKDEHLQSLARFNVIFQGETNDFDRAIEVTSDQSLKAEISRGLSQIFIKLSILSEAFEYSKRSLEIHNEPNNRVGLTADYRNIGIILDDMGRLEEALDSHNKALAINNELNNRVGLAGDNYNIGFVLSKTSKEEALKSLYNALTILQEFEKQNNYHHPLIEQVKNRISYLKEEE
jgi:tetratricopeptide (TPR) repeat protein